MAKTQFFWRSPILSLFYRVNNHITVIILKSGNYTRSIYSIHMDTYRHIESSLFNLVGTLDT